MGETSYTPIETQVVALSTSSAASAVIASGQAGRVTVRLCSDVDCFVAAPGSAPEADTGGLSMPLPANVPEYVDMDAGDKIAAIVASSTGNLYITRVRKN